MWVGYTATLHEPVHFTTYVPLEVPHIPQVVIDMLPITPLDWQAAVLASNARSIEIYVPRVCGGTTLLMMDAVCRAAVPNTTCEIMVRYNNKVIERILELSLPVLGTPKRIGSRWLEYQNRSSIMVYVVGSMPNVGNYGGPGINGLNLYLDMWEMPEFSREIKSMAINRGGRVVEIVHQVMPEDGLTVAVVFDGTGVEYLLDDAEWRTPIINAYHEYRETHQLEG